MALSKYNLGSHRVSYKADGCGNDLFLTLPIGILNSMSGSENERKGSRELWIYLQIWLLNIKRSQDLNYKVYVCLGMFSTWLMLTLHIRAPSPADGKAPDSTFVVHILWHNWKNIALRSCLWKLHLKTILRTSTALFTSIQIQSFCL